MKCFMSSIGTKTISEETAITQIETISPEILLSYLIRYFLKKLMMFPIQTTGWILAGNSPISKSNAKANKSIVSSI